MHMYECAQERLGTEIQYKAAPKKEQTHVKGK